MSLIIPANTLASGGYEVDNSLRFNKGSSDYLNRTFGTSTSEGTWTYSVWLKISDPAFIDNHVFFSGGGASDNRTQLYFGETTGTLNIYRSISGSTVNLESDASFRDPSAWYNLCVQNNAGTVAAYINGVAVTLDGSSLGTNVINKSNTVHKIGVGATATYASSYMSEIVFIDGTVVAPTSFGEFDEDSGIWKPIDVSGLTFGTNGFYLDFEDSSNLGNDANGGTDLTEVNLAATDQSTDTCTNNFATLNVLAGRNNPNAYYATFSEGNLKLVGTSSTNNGNGFSTMAFNTGKWYCEVKIVDADTSLFPCVGVITEELVASANSPSNAGQIGQNNSDTAAYAPDGEKVIGGTESSYGDTFTNNDIIGIAIDCDNGAVYFSKNGTFQASGDPTSGASKTNAAMTFTPGKYYFFGGSVYKDTNDIEFNFGSPPYAISSGNTDGNGYGNFEYAVPSSYYSLNTKNLAEYG